MNLFCNAPKSSLSIAPIAVFSLRDLYFRQMWPGLWTGASFLLLLCTASAAEVKGCLELDNVTFSKLVGTPDFNVLVKFDKSYPYGDKEVVPAAFLELYPAGFFNAVCKQARCRLRLWYSGFDLLICGNCPPSSAVPRFGTVGRKTYQRLFCGCQYSICARQGYFGSDE